ncbi:MAG: hypothetical protein JXA14_20615 [Anaerolineae bacterium]|nr:hypothetical protein [Anaerolineae bacterium]
MTQGTDPSSQIRIQGWKQSLASKKEMLDTFDQAKEKAQAHKVKAYHGRVAEAEFRKWLSCFLPKRYDVTSGYIVSQWALDHTKLLHFDVIVYDQLESPILWVEDCSDLSFQGFSRAIPAEHVYAVIEVKSSLNPSTTAQALKHLFDLTPLLADKDAPEARYKRYLPANFLMAVVFFELRREYEFSKKALNNLVPPQGLRGYFGGIVLRGEGLPPEVCGRIRMFPSETAIRSSVGKKRGSLLTDSQWADSRVSTPEDSYLGPMITPWEGEKATQYLSKAHLSAQLIWSEAEFARFAFDLVALLKGTYQMSLPSSFHGLSMDGN